MIAIKTSLCKTVTRVVVFNEDGTTQVYRNPGQLEQYVVIATFAEREDASAALAFAEAAKKRRANKNYVLPGTQKLPGVG